MFLTDLVLKVKNMPVVLYDWYKDSVNKRQGSIQLKNMTHELCELLYFPFTMLELKI